jgi:GLPGLI family protein
MKSNQISIALLVLTLSASGQEKSVDGITSGKITYEEKVKLEIKLEGDAAQYSSMLPKERKTEKTLSFTSEASLFEDGVNIQDEMASDQGDAGEGVKIKVVTSGSNKIFSDLKNKTVIDQRDFMNRIFLVEKEMSALDWKVTGNQKVILGYPCMEAITQDTAGNKTIAWFAPSINVHSGPAGLGNLPGMVLEADFGDGSRTYIAKSVEPVAQADLKIQRPKEGKKVSNDEYREIVDSKMKEMGVEGGSGSGTVTHMSVTIKN